MTVLREIKPIILILSVALVAGAIYLFYLSRADTEEETVENAALSAQKTLKGSNSEEDKGSDWKRRNAALNPIASQLPPVEERALFLESMQKGYMPTQLIGELGSSHGALFPTTTMQYAPTKYERLADSPLLRFTDEMIWREGEDYVVKRDAMRDQALHIQEASIALSVSARIEWGQLTGYRLVEVPDNTLFSKLGIVSGDVVLSINGGKPDMEPMALMFVNMVALKGESELELEHNGTIRKLRIRAAE